MNDRQKSYGVKDERTEPPQRPSASKYPALGFLASLYIVLGWIAIAGAVILFLAGVLGGVAVLPMFERTPWAVLGAIPVVVGAVLMAVGGMSLIVAGEAIYLAMDIERNTRTTSAQMDALTKQLALLTEATQRQAAATTKTNDTLKLIELHGNRTANAVEGLAGAVKK